MIKVGVWVDLLRKKMTAKFLTLRRATMWKWIRDIIIFTPLKS